eukprot:6182417-Pleurochrysis_carterae.AAC.2
MRYFYFGSASLSRAKGLTLLVNVGYGSDKKTRHMLPSGFYKMVVANVKELEMLLMQNRTYAAEVGRFRVVHLRQHSPLAAIAHNVSARKRKAIIERAAQLNIKVLNAGAKLKAEENECVCSRPAQPALEFAPAQPDLADIGYEWLCPCCSQPLRRVMAQFPELILRSCAMLSLRG